MAAARDPRPRPGSPRRARFSRGRSVISHARRTCGRPRPARARPRVTSSPRSRPDACTGRSARSATSRRSPTSDRPVHRTSCRRRPGRRDRARPPTPAPVGCAVQARPAAGHPAPAPGRSDLARAGQPRRVRPRPPAGGLARCAGSELLALRRRPHVVGLRGVCAPPSRDRSAGRGDRPRRGTSRSTPTRPRCEPAARARRSAGSSSTSARTCPGPNTTGCGRSCTTPPVTDRGPRTGRGRPTSRRTSAGGRRGCRRSPGARREAVADVRAGRVARLAGASRRPGDEHQSVLDEAGRRLGRRRRRRRSRRRSPAAATARGAGEDCRRTAAASARRGRRIGRRAGAAVAHRTLSAARPCRADPLPELHQRLAGAPRISGAVDAAREAAAQHPPDVDVDREHGLLEREAPDRGGDVGTDAGQRGQVIRPARRRRSGPSDADHARAADTRDPAIAQARRPTTPRRAA